MRTSIGKLRPYWAVPALIFGVAVSWWSPSEQYAGAASFEGRLLDLRHVVRGPVAPPADFAIVAIDDKTLGRLKRFPLPRGALAKTIEQLTSAGAKVVAVDLLLLEREMPGIGDGLSAGDNALEQALHRNGKVILAVAATPDVAADVESRAGLIHTNAFPLVLPEQGVPLPEVGRVGAMLPIDGLAQEARLAHVNVPRDPNGAIRRIVLALPFGPGDYLPAMSFATVQLLAGIPRSKVILVPGVSIRLGNMDILTSKDSSIALNHYGGQGTFPTYSLVDVMDGAVAPALLADKAVFIGSTALGFGDTFTSPFSPQLPGVEAQATAAANIATQTFLHRDESTLTIDLIAAGLVGLGAFFAANMRSLGIAGAVTVVLWLTTAAGLQAAFSGAYLWLDATTYVLTLTIIGLATFMARIVQQRRISGHLMRERDNLARYHSPLLTEWLVAQRRPSFNERSQNAAVMFVDVAGFTRRSEHLGPTATVGFLRDLHGRIERAALANRGVIEQFMGDGAMIIFGLPEPAADDAVRALAAAQQLFADLSDWNLDLKREGAEAVRLRFGLHYGPVMAALLGGERQGQITVAGDTVNVASRLQEMGKEHAAIIVASAEFVTSVKDAGRSDLLTGMQRLTGQKVRGRDEVIDLWVWR